MIMDRTLLFSDRQAVTATTASTNAVDLGSPGTINGSSAVVVRDIGKGSEIPLAFNVVEPFNNLTSLGVNIEVDDNPTFTSPRVVSTTTIPVAQLGTNGNFGVPIRLPNGVNERYVRLNYIVTGTAPTLGRVTAGVVMGVQTN